jgi:hypothetical protein
MRGLVVVLFSGLSALVLLASGAPVAGAQTFQLTSCAATELRAAITTANSDDQDDTVILKQGCTYVPTSVLTVTSDGGHSLTVVGYDAVISEGGALGIFFVYGGSLTIRGVALTNFVAQSGAGAITTRNLKPAGSVRVVESFIGLGQGCGGGIYSSGTGTAVSVEHSEIQYTGLGTNCSDSAGILIGQPNQSLLVTRSLISNNLAGGGIIVADGDPATINTSTIRDNIGVVAGGINSAGPLRIYASTIAGNTATGDNLEYLGVGGIYSTGETWITDSTITGNTGTLTGGVAACCNGVTTLLWSTVANNVASIPGRGGTDLATVPGGGGRLSLKATIVAHTNPNGGLDCAPNLDLFDQGYNLADDYSCPFLQSRHSLTHTPAGLDPSGLGNHGGPTQTIALQPNSPAVDYAPTSIGPPIQDQRLRQRPDGGEGFTDIGAYELQDGS